MGNYPSMGSKGGTVIGMKELNLCADCGPCCPVWDGCGEFMRCCDGLRLPSGPEWDAAEPDFQPFLDECAQIAIADQKSRSCGGLCIDVFRAKGNLDNDWTIRANTYLAKHGLQVEVCAFYTSDGKSSTPHLCLQFSKTARSVAESRTERTPLMNMK